MHHVDFARDTEERSIVSRDSSPSSPTGHEFSEFADHLISSSIGESESRLMAIGLEMQALASIYGEEPCRVHAPSRPSSFIGSVATGKQGAIASSSRRNSVIADAIGSASAAMARDVESGSRGSIELPDMASLQLGRRVRYELMLPVFTEDDPDWTGANRRASRKGPATIPVARILVSLPPSYPANAPPQLQLLGRYLGQFSIDPAYFGEVTRTYISQSGCQFTAGDVCVFDGVEHVLSSARKWYLSRLQEGSDGEQAREMDRHMGRSGRALAIDFDEERAMGTEEVLSDTPANHDGPTAVDKETREDLWAESSCRVPMESPMLSETVPAYIKIYTAPPITASRSVFIGHACKIKDPLEVPSIIHQLLSDRKISKATHPVIHAYRVIKVTGPGNGQLILSDNDDDGESAAGGRLAHLLQILELENILVIVSRWYGGVLLGPERFKLINQAARDALELGGFLGVAHEGKGKQSRGRSGH